MPFVGLVLSMAYFFGYTILFDLSSVHFVQFFEQ